MVKASNQFQVKPSLRHLYQAEVLVPSPLPPEFIVDFRKMFKRPAVPGSVSSRVIAPARALQVPSPADPVLQSEAEVDALPLDPVVVGRVATDGGSSDSLEEASDTTARLPQAAPAALPDLPLTCAPLSAVADMMKSLLARCLSRSPPLTPRTFSVGASGCATVVKRTAPTWNLVTVRRRNQRLLCSTSGSRT